MINNISNIIVNYLDKNNVLKEEKDIYIHGARLLVSTFIGTSLLIIIGIISHHFVEAIIYEIIISSSRSLLGGYHCKSYIKCIMTYISMFVMGIIFNCYISFNYMSLLILEIISIIITYKYCPVQNINKIISSIKYKKFKIYSIIYILTYICLLNVLYILQFQYIDILIYILFLIQILTLGGIYDYEKSKK